jgi:hypothetical protein
MIAGIPGDLWFIDPFDLDKVQILPQMLFRITDAYELISFWYGKLGWKLHNMFVDDASHREKVVIDPLGFLQ